jgi:hypothetical protein
VPVTIGLTLAIAATFRPLYEYLKRALDRRIFRDM